MRVGQGDRDDAILEAERREADGIILDVEIVDANALAEILRANQRGKADGQVGQKALRDGEKFFIAPDVGGASGDGLARKATANRLQLVLDF